MVMDELLKPLSVDPPNAGALPSLSMMSVFVMEHVPALKTAVPPKE
jgi:hypothetical protein